MLVIRLARAGRAKYPTYRIVAAESARAATGKFIAVLGHYNPHTKELVIKREEIQKHLSHGAQPSNTVAKLLVRDKVELPDWVKVKTKAAKIVAEPEAEAPVATAEKPEKPEQSEAAPEATEEIPPALEEADQRVAEVNEDAATEAEANVTPADSTDTAEDQK